MVRPSVEHGRHVLQSRIAEALCPEPNPYRTYEEYLRAAHLDVPEMDADEVRRELGRARLAVLVHPEPPEWLTERIEVLERRARAVRRG